MLKKVALVAAASAASVVAISPLAFAHESHETGIDKSGKGLINVSGNNANVPVQACNNDVPRSTTETHLRRAASILRDRRRSAFSGLFPVCLSGPGRAARQPPNRRCRAA